MKPKQAAAKSAKPASPAKKPAGVRTIKADYLARVEGEGGMHIRIKDRKVTDVKLRIFEPPRFFEAFLRGRDFRETPDITARICGICPIAYQMSSVIAMESACGVEVGGMLRELRRLIYCGEWIESHILHVFMLHAPDFLGYESAIHMAKDHRELVELALKLKKAGNELMILVGGREVHPINMRVGGFYKVPTKKQMRPHIEAMKWARDMCVEATKVVAGLKFPDFQQEYEFVSMRHPDEYPLFDGRLVSNKGVDLAVPDFESQFAEEHAEYSNALQGYHKVRGAYFVGPMARYALNFDKLPEEAQSVARDSGLGPVCMNPFKSIIVRMVETLWATIEALRVMENYEEPDAPCVEVTPRAATGCGCSEAPRGICWHRYRIDDRGIIQDARIVPPTSQNQKVIERDLYGYVEQFVDLPDDKLQWQCEQAVRNYDPCISCATHFLKLDVVRE